MRKLKRIPIILKALVDKKAKIKLLEYWYTPTEGTQLAIDMPYFKIKEFLKVWEKSEKEFSKYWMENPDLRLGQALINYGIIADIGVVFYEEDLDSIVNSKILEPRDIYFWGSNFDSYGVPIRKTVYTLIKDLSTFHIKRILDEVFEGPTRYNSKHYKALKEEYKNRKL